MAHNPVHNYHSANSRETYLAGKIRAGLDPQLAQPIAEYVEERAALAGSGEYTLLNLTRNLAVMMETLANPLTTPAVLVMIGSHRRRLKQNTFRLRMHQLLPYLSWLLETGRAPGLDLEKIRQVRVPARDTATKTAEEMVREEEVLQLIAGTVTSRDRALIGTFYEAGLRTKEVAMLTWGDVRFDPDGYILNTSEKTGRPRYIRCIWSAQYLADWKNVYPGGDPDPARPVFVSLLTPHGPLTYGAIRAILLRSARRAGYTRHIMPGHLRHSHITNQYAAGVPEGVIKLIHWGNLQTNQLATYAHLTNQDIDNAVLSYSGVEAKPRTQRGKILPVTCRGCGAQNVPAAKVCRACFTPLSEDYQAKRARILQLTEDPDFLIEFGLWLKDRARAADIK